MAYIYKITNKLNGKIYIGKTIYTIEKRWNEHKSCVLHNREKTPLHIAMQKYGCDNFTIEQIEECSDDIVNEKEIYWIAYYNSYHNGYNATLGGEGAAKCDDYNLIYNLWSLGKNVSEIANITNHSRTTIQSILNKNNISIEERKIRANRQKGKITIQRDKDTNEILNIFSTAGEAAKFLGKDRASHIQDCCRGRRKTAYGFKWEYIE